MIITLTGTPGSGKTTIGKLLAQRLGYEFFSTGMFRRQMAKERGMTLEEFNRLGETDPSTDLVADEYQKKLGLENDNFVIDGKTAFHFIPHSIKIFITADDDVRARRIFYDKNPSRNQQKTSTVEEQMKLNDERMAIDNIRYTKYYHINCSDMKNYDFILDTSHENDAEKNMEKIIDYLKSRNLL